MANVTTIHKFDPECKRPKTQFYQWLVLRHQLRNEDLTAEERTALYTQMKKLEHAVWVCLVCKRTWPTSQKDILIDGKFCCEQCKAKPEPIRAYLKNIPIDDPQDSIDVILRNAHE
jgi:hypothetical protein